MDECKLESFRHVGENTIRKSLNEAIHGITITWDSLNVYGMQSNASSIFNLILKREGEKKQILNNLNGIAKPGQILAVMGSSGSGKTTLLNVLNFRNLKKLSINGNVHLNGKLVKSAKDLSFVSAYVQQDDLFLESLTVKEHLTFQAMLRMESGATHDDRLNRVDEIVNDLNLKKCENNFIGGIMNKGISGGERRRLSFATELITNASLLFVDEPTSGLDSYMALSVVDCMKTLANQGRTIICTIHQPSSDIFELFDRLCLLTQGRLAYIGLACDTDSFFRSQNYECPENYNPADYYIAKLAIKPSKQEECIKNVNEICDNFEKSEFYEILVNDIQKTNEKLQDQCSNAVSSKEYNGYQTNSFKQIRWLLWRSTLNSTRNKVGTQIRMIQTLYLAILFGCIYFQQDLKQSTIRNINGVLFLTLMNTTNLTFFTSIISFQADFTLVMTEHVNGMYRLVNYFIAKLISEVWLPLNILLPTIYFTTIYWMTDLNNDIWKFLTSLALIILVANIALAVGGLLSVSVRNVSNASRLGGTILIPLNIFGGYYINKKTVPSWLIWFEYVSWVKYGSEVLLVNQWSDVSYIPCEEGKDICYKSGREVLESLEMNEDYFYADIGAMIAIYVAIRLLTYFVLALKSYYYTKK